MLFDYVKSATNTKHFPLFRRWHLIPRFSHFKKDYFLHYYYAGKYSGTAAELLYFLATRFRLSNALLLVPIFSRLTERLFIPEIAARKQIHVWRPAIELHSRLGIPFVFTAREFDECIRSLFMFLFVLVFLHVSNSCSTSFISSFNFMRVEARVPYLFTYVDTKSYKFNERTRGSTLIMFELKNVLPFRHIFILIYY